MATPDPKTTALATIRRAAQQNTASSTNLDLGVYTAAGVTGMQDRFLATYNSALDSAKVTGAAVNSTAKIQDVVAAVNAILYTAEASYSVPVPGISGAQFAAIGVTGVSGAGNTGSAQFLLKDALIGISLANADTVAEVQAMADAAQHVIAAAGGTARQAAALTLDDFGRLGVSGVSSANLAAVQQAIRMVKSDANIDTRKEIQDLVNAQASIAVNKALGVIATAAQSNSATAATVGLDTYAAAGVTGVYSTTLASINSALNSQTVTGSSADTSAEVQAIVNDFNAILAQSDTYSGVPKPTPVAAQFATIGVTGLSGADSNGVTHLLDDAIFGIGRAKVDTVAEVQAIADAANHVMAAAGGTAAQAAALGVADFSNLGITGVTAANLAAAQAAIRVASDADVQFKFEVQGLINAKLANDATSALGVIGTAAENNTATDEKLNTDLYATAGVSGVDSSNLAAINSALNSDAVGAFEVFNTASVQNIVNAYKAILHSADGVAGNTAEALTAAQYSAIGVTGVSGLPTGGTALHLLNDLVDSTVGIVVDTVPELQAVANATSHIVAAAGGTAAAAAAVSVDDLQALRLVDRLDTSFSLSKFQELLHALPSGAEVDTRGELTNLLSYCYANDIDTSRPSPAVLTIPLDWLHVTQAPLQA